MIVCINKQATALYFLIPVALFDYFDDQRLTLLGQANKCTWWMPWRLQAMKDVVACDKLRGAGKQALIRRFPNGETRP